MSKQLQSVQLRIGFLRKFGFTHSGLPTMMWRPESDHRGERTWEGLGTSYEHSRAINHSCHNTCPDLHSKHCYVAMTLVPRLPTRRISKTPGPLSSQNVHAKMADNCHRCLGSRMRTKRTPQPHGIAQHAEVSRQGFKLRPAEARPFGARSKDS